MDFIQQAIDKAREQRQTGHPDVHTNAQPGEQSGADTRGTARQTPPPHSTPLSPQGGVGKQKIEYTQTRVVELNPEHLRRERIIAAFEDDKRAESYRQLRTQILRKFRENNWHTLAITSPNSQAGKTLTAVNLAISLSLEVNQTVMLVELDLRNPSILDKMGLEHEYGLVDVVQGEAELSQALVNPGFERLVILPNRGMHKHKRSSELLSSPQMGALLHDIVNRYESRLIIFDLPALLDDDDALVFAPYADATLLVVEDCVSKRADIERSLQLLQGTRLLGTVLNKVR